MACETAWARFWERHRQPSWPRRLPMPPLPFRQPPPPPVPSPPAVSCAGGWPEFNSAAELSASAWAGYITDVYGSVPQGATYPWCMGDLWVVYTDRLAAHGVEEVFRRGSVAAPRAP